MTRTDIPPTQDERTVLRTILDFTRETAIEKVEGLTDGQAQRALLDQSPLMAPGAIINHLRWVENWWFEIVLLGRPDEAPMTEDDPDGEFRVALTTPISTVIAEYREQIRRSDVVLSEHDLDLVSVQDGRDFRPTLRWIVSHMIEETARHNGHLDILREQLDGSVGR